MATKNSMRLSMNGQASMSAAEAGRAEAYRDILASIMERRQAPLEISQDTTFVDPAARLSKRGESLS